MEDRLNLSELKLDDYNLDFDVENSILCGDYLCISHESDFREELDGIEIDKDNPDDELWYNFYAYFNNAERKGNDFIVSDAGIVAEVSNMDDREHDQYQIPLNEDDKKILAEVIHNQLMKDFNGDLDLLFEY